MIFKHCAQVVNACMDNTYQAKCPFCHVLPKKVNQPDTDFTPISDEAFCELCLSILHFTINTFNHFCKVGARIRANVKEYRPYGKRKNDKIKVELAKIKEELDNSLHLQLQKKHMADGNMARTAFNNLEVFSQILRISVELLHMFNVIRIALASSLKKVH